MIKKKNKAILCAIASVGFMTSIKTINVNAMTPKNTGLVSNIQGINQDNEIENTNSNNYFSDIKDHWAKKDIEKFINLGYINGYSDKTFKPNNSITRAEFVKILNNTFGLTKSSGKVFSDTQNHWAKNDIDVAVTNGICKGKSYTEFKPNDPITREEAALMISNYEKIANNNHDKINEFSDTESVSNWAKDGVEGVIEKGYMHGYTDNTFKPKGNITRAEAVSTLSRVNEDEANSDIKLNQEEANKVITRINKLNRSISVNDEIEIKNTRDAYNNLNKEAKTLVTNLNVLENAEASLNKINNAIDLIQAIPGEIYKINECTDAQVRKEFAKYKEQVKKAEEAYNNLNEDEKKSVSPFDLAILNTGKIMVRQLEEVNADILKGKNFVDRVNALQSYAQYKNPEEIKAIIKEIKDLRDIYENFQYHIQVVIPDDVNDKLFKAECEVMSYENQVKNDQSNQEEANKVIDQINNIKLNQTSFYEEEITKARSAYNNLNEKSKSLVTNLDRLESSEKILNVINSIYNLPEDITLDNKTLVQEVRNAYNDLTDEEKANITEFDLAILTSAELKISALEKIESDKVTAQDLVKRIDALDSVIASNNRDEVLSKADEIKAIREAYENLDYYVKKSVTNYEKLFKAECKLAQVL